MAPELITKTGFFSIFKRGKKEYAQLNGVKESVMVAAKDVNGDLLFISKYLPAYDEFGLVFPGGIVG